MAEASEGSEAAQQAREGIEAAEQHLPQRTATRIAVMIGAIAFAMAALQFAQRGVQEEADAKGKLASEVWAFYENKSVRATALQTAAMVLAALPGADKPEIPGPHKGIAHERSQAARRPEHGWDEATRGPRPSTGAATRRRCRHCAPLRFRH